ncbi:MAG: glycine--tRNA ligase subunit beta, partial [Sphingomonas sp.]
RQIIALGATMAARKAGLELVQDEGLLTENAGLTEWPVPLLGRFDEGFLSVPPEVIQLTARVNQKYFVCRDASGALANAFVCTANIDAADGGAKIVEGNRKVLAARLSDAKFFYETDLKVPLEEQAAKLDRIVFHEKLGTVADKVARIAKLARWLVEEGIVPPTGVCVDDDAFPGEGRGPVEMAELVADSPSSQPPAQLGPGLRRGRIAQMAFDAARLCKADLVTGMVGEFPELQGLMGGYYAAAQGKALGEAPRVAAAIRDHYKPVGQGDDVPTDPVTVAVSLADKLDTLFGFFAIGETPTGSRDPFALRRAAIGIISLLTRNNLRMPYFRVMFPAISELGVAMGRLRSEQIQRALNELGAHRYLSAEALKTQYDEAIGRQNPDQSAEIAALYETVMAAPQKVADFLADRLKVQQREAGVRHDLIDAVFALGGEDDLVRLLARVHALQAFIGTADGANLLAGYKRAANILKKEGVIAAPLPGREGLGVGRSVASGVPVSEQPTPDPSLPGRGGAYTPEPAEAALALALDSAEPAAAAAVAREEFEAAMAALATLRAPIDRFFDEGVIVNDPVPEKRAARLALLDRVRAAVHNVADFSKIEG